VSDGGSYALHSHGRAVTTGIEACTIEYNRNGHVRTVIIYAFAPSVIHECPSRRNLKKKVTRAVGMVATAYLGIGSARE
jgi:hypothetical protein